jgi:HAD superfamily hydrolase (TIGR01509 family)
MHTAVIFDVDGTLVDSVDLHARAWREALRDFGYDVPFPEIRDHIGKGADQLMPVFVPSDDLARRGRQIQDHRAKVFRARYLPHVTAFPRVRDLLARVKSDGQRVALASSAQREELRTYKQLAGIDALVDVEVSADDAERSKPHADIFEAALAELGPIDPASVVVVGDTPDDAVAAVKAGLQPVGVLSGGFPEKWLTGAGCVGVYRDAADLLARYDGSALSARARSRDGVHVTPNGR